MSKKQKKHEGSYSPLTMEYLRNIVPNAHLYMKYLRDLDLIEWVNHSQGRNSRMYRLVKEGRTVSREIQDQQLINRIEAAYRKKRLHNSKKYPFLNKSIYNATIDFEAAKAEIDQEYEILRNDSRRNYFLSRIQEINSAQIKISVNDTNKRLNSTFTNLPPYLTKHLRLNGYPPVELDLVNSQPFVLATMINPRPAMEEIIVRSISHTIINHTKKLKLHQREDVNHYTSLVTSGTFYDYMAEQFQANGIPFKDRDDLKQQLFGVFNGHNRLIRSKKYGDVIRLFRHLFPGIYGLLYSMKLIRHKEVANVMTTLESYLVLDKVIPAIENRWPDLPLLTKHDAIMPFEQSLYVGSSNGTTAQIKDLIEDTIEEISGLRPTIKVKKY